MIDKLLGGGLISQLPAMGNINQLLGGIMGGQLMDGMSGQGGQGGQGLALGGLAALLGGQQQDQPQQGMNQLGQDGQGQMAQQPMFNSDQMMQPEGQAQPIEDRRSKMAKIQRAMKAAEAAKSGDIMSLVESLILAGE